MSVGATGTLDIVMIVYILHFTKNGAIIINKLVNNVKYVNTEFSDVVKCYFISHF